MKISCEMFLILRLLSWLLLFFNLQCAHFLLRFLASELLLNDSFIAFVRRNTANQLNEILLQLPAHVQPFRHFFHTFVKFKFEFQLIPTLFKKIHFTSFANETRKVSFFWVKLIWLHSTNRQCAHSIFCILLLPPHKTRPIWESLIDFFGLLLSNYYSSSPRRNKKRRNILKR